MAWSNLPRFTPHPAFANAHVQTIASHLLKVPKIEERFEAWVVPVSEGDELWCRFYPGSEQQLDIYFHGLGGDADSNYMQLGGRESFQMGRSVLLVNHRGAGEGLAHASGIYHSGRFDDAAAVIRFAREKMPQAQITVLGFSLSANLVLNLVGRETRHLPDRAIAVNPPIDVFETARLLVSPGCFVYDQKFVIDLRKTLSAKVRVGRLERVPDLPKFCRLIDFDEIYTAPTAGFKNREELYKFCCSYPYADRIQVPTLILTAEDDPFIPADRLRLTKYGPGVQMQIEKHGGHVGYLSKGKGPWPRRFLAEFLRSALEA